MARKRRGRLWSILLGILLAGLLLEAGAYVWVRFLAGPGSFERHASLDQLRARYGQHARVTPHRHLGYAPTPNYVHGGNRHNSLGFRGDEIEVKKPAGVVRVVLAGGSTTYCDGVMHEYRWSHAWMLQERYRQLGAKVEVVNAGCPGWTTLETLINFQTRVLDLEPDVLVVYHAFNDALTRLVWPSTAYKSDLSGWFSRTHALQPASLLERSTLARILMIETGSLVPHGDMLRILGDLEPTNHAFTFRSQRLAGTYPSGVFATTPVETMLAANPPVYFERNLRSLIALADAHRVKVVLATFAVSSAFPKAPFVGHPGFRAAIAEHNDILRRLAHETSAHVLELADTLAAEPALFTDGLHFNAAGNWRRAELIREYLRQELGIGGG